MSAAAAAEHRLRVLLVDDDPNVRTICATNLMCDGFEVTEAADGQTGLELALAEPPDLLLLDVSMPGLNGLELTAALRRNERTRELPVVFLSGESESTVMARADELGALGFLAKPFDPAAVSRFIAGTLTRSASPAAGPLVPSR